MIVGKQEKVVKGDCSISRKIPKIRFYAWKGSWFSNTTTRNCIYLLDTTRDSPQNHRNFSNSFLVQ